MWISLYWEEREEKMGPVVAQRHKLVVGLIPTRENERMNLFKFIFSFLCSGVEAKRGVEFCQSTRYAYSSALSGEGCYIRDTAWRWKKTEKKVTNLLSFFFYLFFFFPLQIMCFYYVFVFRSVFIISLVVINSTFCLFSNYTYVNQK